MRLLLDTNVLLDFFQRRQPFFNDFRELLFLHFTGDVELWASVKSFTDIHYVAARQKSSVEVQRAFASSESFLHICSIDGSDVMRAARAEWRDFEDCLIYQAAQKVKADYIVTRDAAGFEAKDIPSLSPRELLVLLRERFEFLDENGTPL